MPKIMSNCNVGKGIIIWKIIFVSYKYKPKLMKGFVKSTSLSRSDVMVKSQMARSAL